MTEHTALEKRVKSKVKRLSNMTEHKVTTLSKQCTRGQVINGCSNCFKKDCPCDCHRRVGPERN
jgi:hypothetical protein